LFVHLFFAFVLGLETQRAKDAERKLEGWSSGQQNAKKTQPESKLFSYSSITRDAIMGKIEQSLFILTPSQNLGYRNSLSDEVEAVLVGKDTERDSVVVGSAVRTDVIHLTVRVLVLSALEEIVHVQLLALTVGVVVSVSVVSVLLLAHLRFVQVRAVLVVVTTDVAVTFTEVQVVLVLAKVT
jgi:hypothetical protein